MSDKKNNIIYSKLLPGQETYTTSDILRILDIKKQRLRQWTKLGYVEADVQVSTGSGNKSIFSIYQVYQISLFKKFVELGLNRWISGQFAQKLDYTEWQGIVRGINKFMIISGSVDRSKEWQDSLTITLAKKISSRINDFDLALIINLSAIVEEVNSKKNKGKE
jgi:hypothetical protein